MVRPTQERETIALTDLQSLAIGDGSDTGDGGIDFDGGGTNPDDGGGAGDQAGNEVYTIIDSSAWGGLIDYNTARWWDITLTDDLTPSLTGAPPNGIVGRLHVVLRQGTGAPWTVTWPASVLWRDTDGTEGGPAPTLSEVEDALDVFVFTTFDAGTTWGGAYDSVGTAGDIDAIDVDYDNSESGLDALNVQDAIDEIVDSFGLVVTSVGSITAGGSPGTIINDATWNEFPGAIRLDASRILLVYRGNGTDHITDGEICGQILTLNGTRDGLTSVGTKFTILSDSNDLRVEDGVSIIDDQIVVAYREYTGTANTAPQIIICDDAPADFTSSSTWGTPISIPLSAGSVQNYTQGHVHKLASGDYFVGAGHQSAGDHTVGIWKWDGVDGLDDPSGGAFITVASGTDDFAEIAVEELSAGNLVALVRSVTDTNIQKNTSADSGDTWTGIVAGFDGYGYPTYRLLLSGLILTVYRDAPNGDNAWRTSANLTSSWSSETILDTTGTRSAYATILQVTPNVIFCAYAIEYSSGGATGTADIFYQFFADSSTFSVGISPSDADYLVGTANSGLSNEIVVGTTPGGELGGTWASPTVDATHAGSTHIALSSATPLIESGAGAAGSGTAASKDDHVHPESSSGGGIGPILITDTPSTPLIFADLIQNEDQDDLVYADP